MQLPLKKKGNFKGLIKVWKWARGEERESSNKCHIFKLFMSSGWLIYCFPLVHVSIHQKTVTWASDHITVHRYTPIKYNITLSRVAHFSIQTWTIPLDTVNAFAVPKKHQPPHTLSVACTTHSTYKFIRLSPLKLFGRVRFNEDK